MQGARRAPRNYALRRTNHLIRDLMAYVIQGESEHVPPDSHLEENLAFILVELKKAF